MRFFFRPAIWMMGRMRYTYKFVLLGAMVAMAVGFLVFNLYSDLNQTVEYSQAKRSGNATVEQISRLVQALQQHRGLSAGVLGGNVAMKERREVKEKEVGELFKAVAGRLPPTLQRAEPWAAILGEWESLRAVGMDRAGAENFAAHTQLIDRILTFNIDVADATTLTFDPDVDTYYLVDTTLTKLPLALERLGQLRARGTAILSRKEISEQQKVELSSLAAEIEYALRTLRNNLDKTARYSPSVAPAIRGAAEGIATAAGQILKLVRDDIIGGHFAIPPGEYFDRVTTVIDGGYQQAHDILQPALRSLIEAREGASQRRLLTILGTSLLMLAIMAYFAAGTYYVTVDNVGALAAGARRIAGGDLTARIILDSNDEHNLVGDSFNEMAATFARLLGKVRNGAQEALDTAMHIAQATTQIAASSNQQSESAAGMAAAVEEMSTGVESISRTTRDAHEVSAQAGVLSTRGGEIVGTVVAGIEQIADAVKQSASTVENLGRHSERIAAVVGVIKEIADQTNLLALNAAIEAARAGESGRGFAVVADEVRKLAERTAQSTQEIAETISLIQGSTQGVVAGMQDGVDRVDEGVRRASEAGEAMLQIEAGARQVVGMVSDISSALHEQSAAGTEIARNVEIIARMAGENSTAVTAAAATAVRLEQLAASLAAEVEPFRIA